jgi:hypothetical protein
LDLPLAVNRVPWFGRFGLTMPSGGKWAKRHLRTFYLLRPDHNLPSTSTPQYLPDLRADNDHFQINGVQMEDTLWWTPKTGQLP